MMAEAQAKLIQAISICVMGASIGWLSGLSVSPVIGAVLSSLVGIGAGIVTGLRVISREGQGIWAGGKYIDARPAALFMLAIAVTALLGIMARTHNIFGPPVDQQAMGSSDSPEPRDGQLTAGLLSGLLSWNESERCDELVATERDDAFRDNLRASGDEGTALVEAISDVNTLRHVVRALCSE